MNWLLVAIIAGHPIATDLRYRTLVDCQRDQTAMRAEYLKLLNIRIEFEKPDEKARAAMLAQIPEATCIPAK